MRDIIRWGIVIGMVASAVAWIGQLLSSSKGVSLFPDLLSLLAWVATTTIGLRQVLPGAISRNVAAQRATALGATAGVIICMSMLVRGLLLWSSPPAPFLVVAMVSSLALIVIIMNVIALATWRASHAGVV